MKQREVRRFIQEHRLSFCGLVETKVKEENKTRVMNNIDRTWSVLGNYESSPSGRVWVCWNPRDVDVALLFQNDQVMHCCIQSNDSKWRCVISIVYGENCPTIRMDLWREIEVGAHGFEGVPWLIVGDFNAVRYQNEAKGGSLDWPAWKNDLNDCIMRAGVEDLRHGGFLFTWSNRKEVAPILRKLDRALINMDWDISFPGSDVQFLPSGLSDHSPMVIKLADLLRVRIPFLTTGRITRIFCHWLKGFGQKMFLGPQSINFVPS